MWLLLKMMIIENHGKWWSPGRGRRPTRRQHNPIASDPGSQPLSPFLSLIVVEHQLRFLYNQRRIIIKYFRAMMILKVKPLRGWNVVRARAEEQTRGRSDPAPTTWGGGGIQEFFWQFGQRVILILHFNTNYFCKTFSNYWIVFKCWF